MSCSKKQSAIQLMQNFTATGMGGICFIMLFLLSCVSPLLLITFMALMYNLICGGIQYESNLPIMTVLIFGSLAAVSTLFGYNLFAVESKKFENRLALGNHEHRWCIIAILACNILAMICCDFKLPLYFFMIYSLLAAGSFLILTIGGPIVKPASDVRFIHHNAGQWICKIVPAAGSALQGTPFVAVDNKNDIEAPANINTTNIETMKSSNSTSIVYNFPPADPDADTPPMYSAALETMNQIDIKQ
jgi:hypothetical protein